MSLILEVVFMKILYLAREYPPHVYGGAGVHLENLVREMAGLSQVEVRCFGDQRDSGSGWSARGYPYGDGIFSGWESPARGALMAMETCLRFAAEPTDADIVHCHTWYSYLGGILAKLTFGIPLVITVHSLEPLRPWKREQLGTGYDLSLWIERAALHSADAVIAVSTNEREKISELYPDIHRRVRVIPNGIRTDEYHKVSASEVLDRYGISKDRPYVLSLGRLSRQKGFSHFLSAARDLPDEVQVVLCAASPDAPGVEEEVAAGIAELQKRRSGVTWIKEHLSRAESVQLYSHAALFCCPSIYEPFGLINLEAMACETPVVASHVGGIPDIIAHRDTGILVPIRQISSSDPRPEDPAGFARDLGQAMTALLGDPEPARAMGMRGRERVVNEFGWDRVARRTRSLYQEVLESERTGVSHEI